jgi:hypothetical protein
METILLNDQVKVIKEDHIYKIEFKTTQYALINSLLRTRIIQGGSTDEIYRHIYFKAQSVKTLEQYLYENKKIHGKKSLLVSDVAKLVRTLSMQLNHLIEVDAHTILGYNPSDIIIINDEKSAFLGSEFVANIDDNTKLATISCPFSPADFFFSPELFKITELPSYVHFKVAYFSLALLIIYALHGNTDFYTEYIIHKQSDIILESLKNHPVCMTKIYWLLSRCLVEEPIERNILLL